MPTVPDVILNGKEFQDVYAETGIEVGKPVTVQNKTSASIYVQNTKDKPSDESTDGFILRPYDHIPVTGQITGLWVKSMGGGTVLVEEIT